jgi:hypothetical protein
LPADARARAWVRGLALINVADSHPLIVPRVRHYLSEVSFRDMKRFGSHLELPAEGPLNPASPHTRRPRYNPAEKVLLRRSSLNAD